MVSMARADIATARGLSNRSAGQLALIGCAGARLRDKQRWESAADCGSATSRRRCRMRGLPRARRRGAAALIAADAKHCISWHWPQASIAASAHCRRHDANRSRCWTHEPFRRAHPDAASTGSAVSGRYADWRRMRRRCARSRMRAQQVDERRRVTARLHGILEQSSGLGYAASASDRSRSWASTSMAIRQRRSSPRSIAYVAALSAADPGLRRRADRAGLAGGTGI